MASKKLSFEEALANLEKIVTEIEEGEVPLEASIERYAQGIALIKQCRSILESAEKKIQLLSRGEGGLAQVDGELEEPEGGEGEPPATGQGDEDHQ